MSPRLRTWITDPFTSVVDLDDGDGVMAILFGKTCGLMAACMKRVCCCCCFYDESMIEPEEVEMGQPQRLPKVVSTSLCYTRSHCLHLCSVSLGLQQRASRWVASGVAG